MTFASPFMATLRTLADVELYGFCVAAGVMRTLRARKNAAAVGRRRKRQNKYQAATRIGRSKATCVIASRSVERASASQQPQQSEQPVRACSSEKLRTPSAAARRIS